MFLLRSRWMACEVVCVVTYVNYSYLTSSKFIEIKGMELNYSWVFNETRDKYSFVYIVNVIVTKFTKFYFSFRGSTLFSSFL